MTLPLEDFFERELTAFGDIARDFSRRFPAEAGRLLPDPRRPADPHLDRFVEGFALLAGRVHHKLDSEFPELTEAMLETLYPQFLMPAPSMSIAQFSPGARSAGARSTEGEQGIVVPKGVGLRSRPLGPQRAPGAAVPCRWRTGYPVTLWPIQVTSAQVLRSYFPAGIQAPPRTLAALVLHLECTGATRFADLALESLRFFLSGDRQVIANLYEMLFNHTLQVAFRSLDADAGRDILTLSPVECLAQVGFEPDEGLLPLPCESFASYRLLTEFLSFREKFLFLDLSGWRQAAPMRLGKKVEVVFFLNRAEENLEQGVNARTFQLGCTPIINLFEKSAEPIAVTQRITEYRIVPARTAPMAMEVMTVDAVTALDPARGQTIDFQPFYAYSPGASKQGFAFWYAPRRESPIEGDRGTEVCLTLVDSDFNPRLPAGAVLHVKSTCSNRDWPVRFQRGGDPLNFESPDHPAVGSIVNLLLPTTPLRPPLRRGTFWRLLAQNNLNHVSLTDPVQGRHVLQEMLRLCDLTDSEVVPQLAAVNHQVIEGISSIRCRPVLSKVSHGPQIGYCRGQEVTLELDERNFVGVGLFLFACVLERFLGLHAAVNSFSQLVARTKQAEGYFKKWPPRAANVQLS